MKLILIFIVEKEETPEYATGVRQSCNAKITFNDKEYFQKVRILSTLTFCFTLGWLFEAGYCMRLQIEIRAQLFKINDVVS